MNKRKKRKASVGGGGKILTGLVTGILSGSKWTSSSLGVRDAKIVEDEREAREGEGGTVRRGSLEMHGLVFARRKDMAVARGKASERLDARRCMNAARVLVRFLLSRRPPCTVSLATMPRRTRARSAATKANRE